LTWSEPEIRDYILDSAYRAAGGNLDDVGEAVTGSTSLVGSGLVDSMGFMNLLVTVEEHFGVEVDLDNSDPEEFTTVDGLTQAVLRSLQRGG
jgi:acyl carrier protein